MLPAPLQLFCVFHLNLAYSSIDEEQCGEVIERCYWPLLLLAREHHIPVGVELTGYTLEKIQGLDPAWVETFKCLLHEGCCELVGSGEAQIIAPLVPSVVNEANLELGLETYIDMLGVRPEVALVQEQAYSKGMVQHFANAGYEAVIVEWDNPASRHPEWPSGWRYLPHYATGHGDEPMPLIWNQSIVFQRFQRYAHGELRLADLVEYLGQNCGDTPRALGVYGNDAEVFDFRPGRFHTEAPMVASGEWVRIARLCRALRDDERFEWILPRRVLDLLGEPEAGQQLDLSSSADPVPVKKQRKYNVSRWAITGRDDLWLNTSCFRIYRALERRDSSRRDNEMWRRLCRLWGSDFRTHITADRWAQACDDVHRLAAEIGVELPHGKKVAPSVAPNQSSAVEGNSTQIDVSFDSDRRLLKIRSAGIELVLNPRRGLTVDALAFRCHGFRPLVGTLPHGYFDDIALGADFYTGGVVIELPTEHRRITDLIPVEYQVLREGDGVRIRALIPTDKGTIVKEYVVPAEGETVQYRVGFPGWRRPPGVVRVGHVTMHPATLPRNFEFACRNGGRVWERFELNGPCIHTAPSSALVSCSAGLGATSGEIVIGGGDRWIHLGWDPAACAAFPMVHHQPSKPASLTRVVFSLAELDETASAGGHLLPFTLTVAPFTPSR